MPDKWTDETNNPVMTIAFIVIGLAAAIFGIYNIIKVFRTTPEEANYFDKVNTAEVDPKIVEGIKNSGEPTEEYYFHFCGRRALFRRERKGTDSGQSLLAQEGTQFLELFLPFTGQAGDDAGTKHHPGDPLTELAEKCFYNPSYFSRVFKKKTALSPSEYRKVYERK